jgi:hypothetical protein
VLHVVTWCHSNVVVVALATAYLMHVLLSSERADQSRTTISVRRAGKQGEKRLLRGDRLLEMERRRFCSLQARMAIGVESRCEDIAATIHFREWI